MSNWICEKCGANYIDVSHQEPSVLKEELDIRKLKELLRECRCFFAEGTKCDLVSYHKNDLFMMLDKIDNAIREKK